MDSKTLPPPHMHTHTLHTLHTPPPPPLPPPNDDPHAPAVHAAHGTHTERTRNAGVAPQNAGHWPERNVLNDVLM